MNIKLKKKKNITTILTALIVLMLNLLQICVWIREIFIQQSI